MMFRVPEKKLCTQKNLNTRLSIQEIWIENIQSTQNFTTYR